MTRRPGGVSTAGGRWDRDFSGRRRTVQHRLRRLGVQHSPHQATQGPSARSSARSLVSSWAQLSSADKGDLRIAANTSGPVGARRGGHPGTIRPISFR